MKLEHTHEFSELAAEAEQIIDRLEANRLIRKKLHESDEELNRRYREVRDRLHEILGLRPSDGLRANAEAMRSHFHNLAKSGFPVAKLYP